MLMNVACASADLFAQQGQRIYIGKPKPVAAVLQLLLLLLCCSRSNKTKTKQHNNRSQRRLVEVNGIKPPRP
jgi:hypothetical protein